MMENEQKFPQKERRVGTFTFGIVLVLTGLFMAAALFFPKVNPEIFLKFSPVILITLGVEVLLSTRKEGRIRYDWVGMILCFLIVCTALIMFAGTWAILYHPDLARYYHFDF